MLKRTMLIVTGSVAGLGGVLAITPPQFGSGSGGLLNSAAPTTSTKTTAASTTPTKKATVKKTTKATSKATRKATPKATKKPATKTTAPAVKSISGTFTGSTIQTNYGPVQVQITVVNRKITAATALQVPNRDFRSQNINSQAVPYLVQETLQAQSANIQGVGGASYTSYGWQQSLASALAKAGM